MMSRYDDLDGAGRKRPRRRGRLSVGGKSPGSKPPGSKPLGGKRRSRWMFVTGSLATVTTFALVLGSLYVYMRYRDVWDSISRIDVRQDLTQRPPQYGNSLNVLLIGSDSRAGRNGAIGGRSSQGARSDTVMVLHISPGRHTVVVLSFPRDSVVPIYQCAPLGGTPGQQAQPAGQIEQINSTFADGGPGCLWKTIERTTHIRIDDFVELTFTGFEKVINDIGGVEVCLPQAVDDPMSGLHLSKGRHHIHGLQALAFWRTREDLGMGSDLQRIQRDQFLMASLLQGIEHNGLLRSPTKLLSVITGIAGAHAITTDTGLTPSRMLQIGESLRGLSTKSVQFIEVPTTTYLPNPNWVQWTPQDSALFAAVAHDSKLPKAKKTKKAKKGSAPVLDAVSPAKVNVEVLNGSDVAGVAANAAASLAARGFNVLGNTNAANFSYTKSVIEYASANRAAARTLKAQLSNVTLVHDSSLAPGTVDLILGSTFTALKAKPSSPSTSVAGLTKQYGGITGNANVCKDRSAFAS
jgi:LCP family protein required for cell wall assembly